MRRERGGPAGRPQRARILDGRLTRDGVAEADFHGCGYPFVSRGVRSCIGCGDPEPRRMLRVREPDGRTGWAVYPSRGGR